MASYWKPAYKYIRIKWQASNEDAKDLTQGFFAAAIEKDYFASYDSAKASFQTFFRICLDRFVANQKKAEQRLKRGGGADRFSLDFGSAEDELAHTEQLPAPLPKITSAESGCGACLTWQSKRSLGNTTTVVAASTSNCSNSTICGMTMLRPKVSYASLANEFGLNTTDVTNYLAAARREFRKVVLEKLREITASEEEFHTEARALLGVEMK